MSLRGSQHTPSHADLSRANLGAALPPDGRGSHWPQASDRQSLTDYLQVMLSSQAHHSYSRPPWEPNCLRQHSCHKKKWTTETDMPAMKARLDLFF